LKKRSYLTLHLKNAAGVLAFLSESALPKLGPFVDSENTPSDLTADFVKSLEWLMLAQAQECVWQRAVAGNNLPRTFYRSDLCLDHYKNSLIAKLAARVSSLYNTSLLSIRLAAADSRDALPPVSMISWLPPRVLTQANRVGSLTWRRSTIISMQHHNIGKVSTNSRPLGW